MPSSFIDIMMLRPAVRISVIAVCSAGSSTSTTPPHAPVLSQRQAEIAHQLVEPHEPAHVLVLVVLGELDEQDRLGIAAHDRVDGGLEHRDVAREPEHGAIDQLDRDRPELDDVLRRLHRRDEAAEVAGADGAPAEQRRELELDPVEKASVPSEPTRICARLRSLRPGTSASRL